MKAKDYFEKYEKRYPEVINAMYDEINVMVKARRVATDQGLVAIFKEQDKKWRAYLRIPEIKELDLRPDAFIDICVNHLPFLAVEFPEAAARVKRINYLIEERRKNEERTGDNRG